MKPRPPNQPTQGLVCRNCSNHDISPYDVVRELSLIRQVRSARMELNKSRLRGIYPDEMVGDIRLSKTRGGIISKNFGERATER
jgi:hypothetical protein